jgi:hypothetical protein
MGESCPPLQKGLSGHAFQSPFYTSLLDAGYDALLATIKGRFCTSGERSDSKPQSVIIHSGWTLPVVWPFAFWFIFIVIENDLRIDFRDSLREAWLR